MLGSICCGDCLVLQSLLSRFQIQKLCILERLILEKPKFSVVEFPCTASSQIAFAKDLILILSSANIERHMFVFMEGIEWLT